MLKTLEVRALQKSQRSMETWHQRRRSREDSRGKIFITRAFHAAEVLQSFLEWAIMQDTIHRMMIPKENRKRTKGDSRIRPWMMRVPSYHAPFPLLFQLRNFGITYTYIQQSSREICRYNRNRSPFRSGEWMHCNGTYEIKRELQLFNA